ncbi:MAG: efflux RND transporter permease subunit [Candidatus Obscuribacterales bacterium]|nr:efflux RND transporter permease subunit [Candidatus Obscuribacterales bacterium]
MTTTAMLAGMMPIAAGLGSGSEARAPMAIAVVGGLFTSTLLTLVVVPVVFTYMDDLQKFFARFTKAPVDSALMPGEDLASERQPEPAGSVT